MKKAGPQERLDSSSVYSAKTLLLKDIKKRYWQNEYLWAAPLRVIFGPTPPKKPVTPSSP